MHDDQPRLELIRADVAARAAVAVAVGRARFAAQVVGYCAAGLAAALTGRNGVDGVAVEARPAVTVQGRGRSRRQAAGGVVEQVVAACQGDGAIAATAAGHEAVAQANAADAGNAAAEGGPVVQPTGVFQQRRAIVAEQSAAAARGPVVAPQRVAGLERALHVDAAAVARLVAGQHGPAQRRRGRRADQQPAADAGAVAGQFGAQDGQAAGGGEDSSAALGGVAGQAAVLDARRPGGDVDPAAPHCAVV